MSLGGKAMPALQLAIENKRYDLAAHILVLSAARAIKNGQPKKELLPARKVLIVQGKAIIKKPRKTPLTNPRGKGHR